MYLKMFVSNKTISVELFKENQKMEASMTTFDSASATSGTASENTESNKRWIIFMNFLLNPRIL